MVDAGVRPGFIGNLHELAELGIHPLRAACVQLKKNFTRESKTWRVASRAEELIIMTHDGRGLHLGLSPVDREERLIEQIVVQQLAEALWRPMQADGPPGSRFR